MWSRPTNKKKTSDDEWNKSKDSAGCRNGFHGIRSEEKEIVRHYEIPTDGGRLMMTNIAITMTSGRDSRTEVYYRVEHSTFRITKDHHPVLYT